MKDIRRLCLFVLGCVYVYMMAACHYEAPSHQGDRDLAVRADLLIGGQPDLRYPAIGALTQNRSKFCTATLITPQLVLTAAHCINSGSIQFRIDQPTGSGNNFTSTYHDVQSQHRHPQYGGSSSLANDIAVIVLAQPVTGIAPIPASTTQMDDTWVGRKLLYLGYGLIQTSPTRQTTNVKYGAEISVRSVKTDRFEARDTGKSICFGDSGGPALYEINGQFQVVGVNSYVQSQQCNGSSFCFRVDAYQSFLKPYLEKYGGKCKSNSDCSACHRCDIDTGKCEAIPEPAIPQLCKPCRADGDCGSGNRCEQRPEGNRCLQPCNATGCCPSGYSCQQVSGGAKFCAPSAGFCPDAPCSSDQDCGPDETCQTNVCKRPGRDMYQDCSNVMPCKPGLICVRSQIGRNICFRDCSSDTSCKPEGGACYTSNDNTKLCLCNSQSPCNSGYTCKLTTQNGLCIQDGTCYNDSDCQPNQICQNTKCTAKPDCQKDGDCQPNQICQNGNCVLKPGSCQKDGDCQPNQICQNGSCVPKPGSCQNDSDCQSNQICQNGSCVPKPGSCQNDSDCQPNQICQNGSCVPKPGSCQNDSDCQPNQICQNAKCVIKPGLCQKDGDCQSGYVCKDGKCVLAPQCENDQQCADGRVCREGVCIVPPPAQCRNDADCLVGQHCENNYCVPKPPPECLRDVQCPPGQICENQRCIDVPKQCTDDTQCSAGAICIDFTCVTMPIAPEPTLDAGNSTENTAPDLYWPEPNAPTNPNSPQPPSTQTPNNFNVRGAGLSCNLQTNPTNAPNLPVIFLLMISICLFNTRK